jgi:hypothetical protein
VSAVKERGLHFVLYFFSFILSSFLSEVIPILLKASKRDGNYWNCRLTVGVVAGQVIPRCGYAHVPSEHCAEQTGVLYVLLVARGSPVFGLTGSQRPLAYTPMFSDDPY